MPNVSVSNTPGLYIGSGSSAVLNSAQQLYTLLSNSGNVNFALINNNTAVQSYFIGNVPGLYTNANVASYLPVYSGNLQANNISLLGNLYLPGSNVPTIVGQVTPIANVVVATGTSVNANVATISLPSAGTWEINYWGQGSCQADTSQTTCNMAIIDDQLNVLPNSTVTIIDQIKIAELSGAGVIVSSSSNRLIITTTGPTTYYLRAYLTALRATFDAGYVSYNRLDPQVLISSVAYTANLSTSGNITANGNITTTNYFIGNGSKLTGISGTYSNVDVAAYLPTYTGSLSNSSTIQSIQANLGAFQSFSNTNAATQATSINSINANLGAFQTYANATFSTGGGSSYGNANVAAYLPVYGGAIQVLNITGVVGQDITVEPDSANDISLNADTIKIGDNNVDATIVTRGTGNLTLQTHNGDANQGNITLINGANGNIRLYPNGSGVVDIAGNVDANYFIGDGSQLINLPVQSGTYSNTNVAAYLPTYTGTLAQSSTIIDLYSNAATQATNINSINANLGAYQTYANANASSLQNQITGANTNITTNTNSINTINANLGAFQTYANTTFTSYGNTQVAAYIQNNSLTSGGMSFIANINSNGNYLQNTILETTTEKTANIGAISGTITVNANTGPIQTATLVGNITINTNNMSNFGTGETVTLVLTQDGTGSRLLTSNLKYAGGSKTLSTAGSSIDSITITYDGTNYLAALVKGYA